MAWYSDLLGTMRSTFRISSGSNSVTLTTSGVTAARTLTLPDKSGTIATMSDVGGSASIAKGTTTVDFGTGSVDASVFVSNTSVLSTNMIKAWVNPLASSNNEADAHLVEDLTVLAGSIVDNTGFTIYVKCNTLIAHGVYNIGWMYL